MSTSSSSSSSSSPSSPPPSSSLWFPFTSISTASSPSIFPSVPLSSLIHSSSPYSDPSTVDIEFEVLSQKSSNSSADALNTLKSTPSSRQSSLCDSHPYLPYSQSLSGTNSKKNRYLNVLPNGINRVKLLPPSPIDGSDFVNASSVLCGEMEYIAAQAPLPNTIADFYLMLFQRDCQLILMLTKCLEGTSEGQMIAKAHSYWPESEKQPVIYGDFHVNLEKIEKFNKGELVIRTLGVTKINSNPTNSSSSSSHSPVQGEKRLITHIHFIGWPDHGVPTDFSLFAKLFETFRMIKYQMTLHSVAKRSESQSETSSPSPSSPLYPSVVIHCSAGIGRTGTFIGIDIALSYVEFESFRRKQIASSSSSSSSSTPSPSPSLPFSPLYLSLLHPPPLPLPIDLSIELNFFDLVDWMRICRVGMVQTREQYNFMIQFVSFAIKNNQTNGWREKMKKKENEKKNNNSEGNGEKKESTHSSATSSPNASISIPSSSSSTVTMMSMSPPASPVLSLLSTSTPLSYPSSSSSAVMDIDQSSQNER